MIHGTLSANFTHLPYGTRPAKVLELHLRPCLAASKKKHALLLRNKQQTLRVNQPGLTMFLKTQLSSEFLIRWIWSSFHCRAHAPYTKEKERERERGREEVKEKITINKPKDRERKGEREREGDRKTEGTYKQRGKEKETDEEKDNQRKIIQEKTKRKRGTQITGKTKRRSRESGGDRNRER